MTGYRLASEGVVDVDTGETIVPGNPRWPDYQAWLASGNTPLPMPPEPAPGLSQAEIDARAELALRDSIRTQLAADPAIVALRQRSPAEVDAWIQNNVSDLASAKAVLRILARVVMLIARERL